MRSIYLFLTIVIFTTSSVFSEQDPVRGKLADGTPFRTDSEGNQIVDYIAELENSVDYLNQRVISLEDELKSKQDSLERISSSKTASSKFQERDIVDRSDQLPAFPNSAEIEAKRNLESKLAKAEGLNNELREELEILGAKLKSVSAQQSSDIYRGADLSKELESLKASYEVKLSAEQDKQHELEAGILERESRIKELNQQLEEQKEEAQLTIAKLERSLSDAESSTAKQVEHLESQLAQARESSKVQDSSVQQLARAEPFSLSDRSSSGLARLSVSSDNKAPLSLSNMRAFESGRANIQTELNQVKRLVSSRDTLYNQSKGRSKNFSFKLTVPRSKRGLSLKEIESNLERAQRFSEFSLLRADLRDIQNKVNDDVAFMKRLVTKR